MTAKGWYASLSEEERAAERLKRREHYHSLSPEAKSALMERNRQSIAGRREEYLAYQRGYTATRRNRRRSRAAQLKRYGITVDEYDRMHADQEGRCAICRQPEKTVRHGRVQSLAVDHCHTTDVVRSLLCGNCNKALGCFAEDIERMERAILYLQQHLLGNG